MSKAIIRTTSILLLASALLIGCNPKQNNTTAATPVKEEKKEISISDLVKKTSEAEKKMSGIKTKTDYTLSTKMPGFSMEVKMNRQEESTKEPKSSHYVEKSFMMGQEETAEGYVDQGTTYEYSSMDKKWYKFDDEFGSPMSSELLDPFTEQMLDLPSTYELMGDEASDLQHKSGVYTLSFQSSKSKAAERAANFIAKLGLGPMEDPKMADEFMNIKDVKVKNWTLKAIIDEKTFEVKKIEFNFEVTGKTGKLSQEAGVKISMLEEVVGVQDKPIVVPADIKKKAKPFEDYDIPVDF